MKSISRRDFLRNTAALGGSLLMAGLPRLAVAEGVSSGAASALSGKAYAFGMSPNGFPNDQFAKSSILTTLDLATGSIKQTALEMEDGHAAMGALGGRILCVSHHKKTSMMVDKDHNVIKKFVSPEGYLYGGHGLVMKDRDLFVLPLRSANPHTSADTGRFEIYNLTTLQKLDQIDSGGVQPHEIHYIPTNAQELAVTHYGNIVDEKDPLEFNVVDSKLTIIDSQTFKPKRHYMQNDYNALTTHMRVDKDGWAYIVFTQYIQYKKLKVLPNQDVHDVALAELKRLFNQEWDFPVPHLADHEKHLAISLPMLRINTQTGETQVINAGMRHHIRSQSVAYNNATGTAVGLYHHSDNLVLHQPNKEPEVVTNDQLGLTGIRGVTEIPNTTRICVCGTYDDVVVFDLVSRRVEAHFKTSNYNSTHIYHEADV